MRTAALPEWLLFHIHEHRNSNIKAQIIRNNYKRIIAQIFNPKKK